jgi:hypothetical protein
MWEYDMAHLPEPSFAGRACGRPPQGARGLHRVHHDRRAAFVASQSSVRAIFAAANRAFEANSDQLQTIIGSA